MPANTPKTALPAQIGRIHLTIPGDPQPAERARRGQRGNWYTPTRTVDYRERVKWAWRQAHREPLHTQPLTASARFFFKRPRNHYRLGRNAHLLTPKAQELLPPGDLDNLLKGLLDALNTLAYHDDTQIVCLSGIHKHWTTSEPRTELDLWPATTTFRSAA